MLLVWMGDGLKYSTGKVLKRSGFRTKVLVLLQRGWWGDPTIAQETRPISAAS